MTLPVLCLEVLKIRINNSAKFETADKSDTERGCDVYNENNVCENNNITKKYHCWKRQSSYPTTDSEQGEPDLA